MALLLLGHCEGGGAGGRVAGRDARRGAASLCEEGEPLCPPPGLHGGRGRRVGRRVGRRTGGGAGERHGGAAPQFRPPRPARPPTGGGATGGGGPPPGNRPRERGAVGEKGVLKCISLGGALLYKKKKQVIKTRQR